MNLVDKKGKKLMNRRKFIRKSLLFGAGTSTLLLAKNSVFLANPINNSSVKKNIKWFKTQFQIELSKTIKNTPFSIDMIAAIAVQETGYLWRSLLKKGLSTDDILKLCVGDTLDYPKRRAFPKNKKALLKAKDGKKMFKVARKALEDIGKYNSSYGNVAKKYPNKFCRGFGILQYDLQFYKNNPDFFLNKDWHEFDKCADAFVNKELKPTLKRVYGNKLTLTDKEMVYVAIAYNKGSVNLSKGFKQGYRNPNTGKYYGEYIYEYLKLSKTIKV